MYFSQNTPQTDTHIHSTRNTLFIYQHIQNITRWAVFLLRQPILYFPCSLVDVTATFQKPKRNSVSELYTLLQNRPLFQAICPGCLWARDNRWLLSRVHLLSQLVAPLGTKGPTLLSRLVTPTRTKGWPFYPGWWYQLGQKDPFIPVGVTNPDKRPLHVIVQNEVILYRVTCTT